jgi:hypothetical protein
MRLILLQTDYHATICFRNAQGQFGANSRGVISGGNGGAGGDVGKRQLSMFSGLGFPSDRLTPTVNIGGNGGDGNAQGQFGSHSQGIISGGNGGNGGNIIASRLI